jgi:hypothetical protein
MDRRLGRPLPHQLPNPTRANPKAINLSPEGHIRYYSQFPGAIPYLWAYSLALLTRPPLRPKSSLDLHVLGLPPAFVLSQDQTLKLKSCYQLILDVRTSAHPSARLGPMSLCLLVHRSSWNGVLTNSEADTQIIGRSLLSSICSVDPSNEPNRPHISSVTSDFKERRAQNRTGAPFTFGAARPTCPLFLPLQRRRRFGEGVFTSRCRGVQGLFFRKLYFFRRSPIFP